MDLIQPPMFVALVVVASLAGCTAAPESPARSPESAGVDPISASSPDPSRTREVKAAASPERAHPHADDAPPDELAVDGQVAALRQAIALYRQFIERAEHDSEYAEAVQRSRERIEDAQATIDFLLAGDANTPEGSAKGR